MVKIYYINWKGEIEIEQKILIFGHKNPDTDSICSSLVKEILERKSGNKNVKAVRLGNVNKETQYVLNYLGIEAPELIEGVEEGQAVILVDHDKCFPRYEYKKRFHNHVYPQRLASSYLQPFVVHATYGHCSIAY